MKDKIRKKPEQTPVNAKGIIIKQMTEHKFGFGVLLISLIINGLITGSVCVEALRRITAAIWDRNKQELAEALLLFAIIIVVTLILTMIQRKTLFEFTKTLVYFTEDTVYRHFAAQEYWEKDQMEDTLGHLRKVISDTMELLAQQISNTCGIVVVILSGCLYGMFLNPYILMGSVIMIIAMVVVSRKSNGQVPELYQEFGEQNSRMYNLLWEQVRNREIAGFLDQDKVLAGYEKSGRVYLKVLSRIKKATNAAQLFSQFGSMILIVFVSLVGGILVINGRLGFADLLAMIILIQTIASRFFQVPELLQSWKKVQGNCRNIDFLLRPCPSNQEQRMLISEKIHSITVCGLSFAYPSQKEPILQGIELTLSEGIFYTIAGASGCGKTTLLHLISRLIPGWQGEIWIDSCRLEYADQADYWKHLALAGQIPVIVPGTLRYNVTLDEEQYDQKRLERAVKDAGLEAFLGKTANGYETTISEEKLSKGEKQKINIARALYRSADVLLLDEITEGLDPESEAHVLKALRQYVEEGMMVVCISHKLGLLQQADQVIFMKKGHIEEIAPHAELKDSSEDYRILIGGMEE